MSLVHATAWVDPLAQLAEDVEVGPFAAIEADAQIGAGSRVGAHVYVGPGVVVGANASLGEGCVLLARTRLQADCRIEPGAVVGSTGFGFVLHQGQHVHIPQVSGVEIGRRVVIGAGTCVDRGTLEPTRIGDDAEIGAQVQVAHNVSIGPRSKVEQQAGFAGTSSIGADCTVGMQSGMAGQSSLGDRSKMAVRTGNLRKAPPDSDLWGFPARPRQEAMKAQAALARLGKLPDADS
ncbi:UDP-3-O-(3-hydroxymyristoyl)glucosamine N-acyltransferase [bacterium]|nr:UDP-3-O-(3-hydroxymyristoyl)glucosamine N-acyltransferase [bacterium]